MQRLNLKILKDPNGQLFRWGVDKTYLNVRA